MYGKYSTFRITALLAVILRELCMEKEIMQNKFFQIKLFRIKFSAIIYKILQNNTIAEFLNLWDPCSVDS